MVIKKQLISRVKIVRANFVLTDRTRICSEHFDEQFTDKSMPTKFPSRPEKEVKTRHSFVKHFEIDNNNNIPTTDNDD